MNDEVLTITRLLYVPRRFISMVRRKSSVAGGYEDNQFQGPTQFCAEKRNEYLFI